MGIIRMIEYIKILCTIVIFDVVKSQVTWTDIPQIRMGQMSIYENTYIPLNTVSVVDITYRTALTAPPQDPSVVISGFQNYLSYEMIFNVSINTVTTSLIKINLKVGPQTYIKQLNVNYFVCQQNASVDTYFEVITANYRTLFLSNITGGFPGYREQNFTNITTSFVNPAIICPAISGLQYYNIDGLINEVQTQSKWTPGNSTILQTVSVDQKGVVNYIVINTLIVSDAIFPNASQYDPLSMMLNIDISVNASGNTTGWDKFNALSSSDMFEQTDNSLYFGINGFKFSMQQTRLFLLQITNLTDYSQNLKANNYSLLVKLSVYVLANRNCSNTTTPKFWVDQFQCVDNCSSLMEDNVTNICQTCDSVCDGCTGNTSMCISCVAGNNRTLAINTTASPCICNYTGGYVDVGNDYCQRCDSYLVGCLMCSVKDSCDDCGDNTTYQRYNYTWNPDKFKCRCLTTVSANGTNITNYLVTGYCLPYPGCLVALWYITGAFCDQCDTTGNFQKNLTDNSSCICMIAYHRNITTDLCEDICGDGQTPNNKVDVCDDNNTDNGDGCSSKCKIQYGYICTVPVIGGISECAQKQQIKINYLYAQKTLNGNQGILVFALLPEQHLLAPSTFQNSVVTNIPGTKKIRFDPVTSFIYITVDYSVTLEDNYYDVNFTFAGLSIYSPDINVQIKLNGINAKLAISQKPQSVNIIVYAALGISAFALVLALMAAFLGEKMMGIQLILPVQAAFFTMITFPSNILSPLSALWSMKFSNGYNSLTAYDTTTNYMLDNRLVIMKYAGQFVLNYNIMFLLVTAVVLAIGLVQLRILWLQHQQKTLQGIIKKKQDQQKNQDPQDKKEKNKKKGKKLSNQSADQKNQSDDQQTQDVTQKDKQQQFNLQNVEQQLQDARQNMKNWRNFTHMLVDRFFTILIVTSMMKIIFCFYIQLSNLTYTAQIYDNSINAGFFFLTYATIITGLYYMVYDYKNDKIIVFTCNKGKYAMFYIFTFVGFIIVLGAIFEAKSTIYIIAIFSILPIVIIGYQVPYGLGFLDFQNIVAVICQLPFLVAVAVSVILNMSSDSVDESMAFILCYAILGSTSLSILLTIIRMIKMIDCKKVSCFQFTDRKKDNSNDKNRKKNKVVLLQLDMQKDYDQFSQDSVRAVLFERKKNQKDQQVEGFEIKNKQGGQKNDKKTELKKQQKQKDKNKQDQQDDQNVDQLQKIKIKLRKELKQKKQMGKIK